VSSATGNIVLQGINYLIILGAWTVWTHRNRCVFNGAGPDIARALIIAGEERNLWSVVGARGISLLTGLHSESLVEFSMS
jgi:nuclear pore complex protein Nup210